MLIDDDDEQSEHGDQKKNDRQRDEDPMQKQAGF